MIFAGCRSGTGPTEKFVGIYDLELVNGQALPANVASTNGCSRSIPSGRAILGSPGVNSTLPIYSWSVSANDSCGAASPVSTPQAFDSGVWSTDGESLFFEHRWDRSYPITVSSYRGDGNADVSPVRVEFSFDGNTYRFKYVSLTPIPD